MVPKSFDGGRDFIEATGSPDSGPAGTERARADPAVSRLLREFTESSELPFPETPTFEEMAEAVRSAAQTHAAATAALARERQAKRIARHRKEQQYGMLSARKPVTKTVLRMEKVGRTSYLLAHVVVESDLSLSGIEELDELRRKIAAGVQELHPSWIVDTVFVADESLAVLTGSSSRAG